MRRRRAEGAAARACAPLAEKAGVKLTFLPFIVKAVVAALKKHPTLNSAFDEADAGARRPQVLQHRHRGRDRGRPHRARRERRAITKSLLEIAREIARLGEDAKAGKVEARRISAARPSRSRRSASKGALRDADHSTSPRSASSASTRSKQKPVVRDGQIVIGDVMLLSLSFDHRIIDGHVGAAFAYDIIGYLEDPDRLFLEMT